MRITVTMPSTGVVYAPGLAAPVVIEVEQLPAEVAEKTRRLVAEAHLFGSPEETLSPDEAGRSMRDQQLLVVTVEDGDKRRTLRISDPLQSIASAPLREFVQLARELARDARQRRRNQP